MSWLAVLKLVLVIADKVASYLGNDQLLEAGKALANSTNLQRALNATRDAQRARDIIGDHIARDPAFMPDADPNRRD